MLWADDFLKDDLKGVLNYIRVKICIFPTDRDRHITLTVTAFSRLPLILLHIHDINVNINMSEGSITENICYNIHFYSLFGFNTIKMLTTETNKKRIVNLHCETRRDEIITNLNISSNCNK